MAIKFLNSVAVDTDVLFVDTANERVGIGTASPSRNLEVSGVGTGDHTYIKILGDTTKEAILELHADNNASGDRWRIASGNSARLDFRNNGSTKVSFQGSGNVGIGTTSPQQKLDTPNIIIGGSSIAASYRANATLMDNLGGTARFYSLGADNSTGGSYQFNSLSANASAGSGTVMTILNSGNVGIGTTTPNEK